MPRKKNEFPEVPQPAFMSRPFNAAKFYANPIKRVEESRAIPSCYPKAGK